LVELSLLLVAVGVVLAALEHKQVHPYLMVVQVE
jgi:hypothetical protein